MENNNLITSKMFQTMVAIIVSLVLMLSLTPSMAVTVDDTEENSLLSTYIVYVTKAEGGVNSMQSVDLESFYQSFLPVSLSSSDREQRLVYSYRNVVNGFAAKLTAEEVKAMETKEGFVSAHVQKILPLHTTHTPNFLGLHQNLGLWKQSNFGKGIIIGVLDTGITPGHPSFSDAGVPPPPAKWKGKCEFNATACNNKLIGARTFQTEPTRGGVAAADPPIDDVGHGTHTSSTAAGNFVDGASVFGQANGTAAGSLDSYSWSEHCRQNLFAAALLGNGKVYEGESIFQPKDFPSTQLPLVYAGANGNESAAFCEAGSLSSSDVQGKIVLCERGGYISRIGKGQTVKDAGGVAMILMNDKLNGYSTLAEPHVLPATHVSFKAGTSIKAYINSTSSPTATVLFGGTVIGKKSAPEVTSFSSRGPSFASTGILKPDIIGPGKPIIDQDHHPADVFAVGSGHVNPSKANDPGLIYDIQPDDYIPYLCGLNYTNREVGSIVQRIVSCSNESSIPEAQLNYPSFSIIFGSTPQTYTRTVTYVGQGNAIYNFEVVSPEGVDVTVKPEQITFTETNQKATFSVTLLKPSTLVLLLSAKDI
ncbi:hypothetical protein LWI29_007992 [Acer saccharum]|uniref:Uncharacterized protein n=1 Tax=Acer saccharum TaxID=4024 RepID=A0AA39VMN6_ACESA|nr:hypothetical protein LWI29_007992 [Acer saccharum]